VREVKEELQLLRLTTVTTAMILTIDLLGGFGLGRMVIFPRREIIARSRRFPPV